MGKRIWWAAIMGLLIPYAGTLAWTGSVHGEELRYEQKKDSSGSRRILLDRGEDASYMDMEEFLPGVLARQIPVEYEPEALKAQAIIARTYICRQMEAAGDSSEIAESALDMDLADADQLKKLWGTSIFPEYYEKLEQAVKETRGEVITYEGEYIDPMFCRASAGMTRTGDSAHPYLLGADCPKDMEAEGFMQLEVFSEAEFAQAVNSISSPEGEARTVQAEGISKTVQIGARDEAGYVGELQIGGFSYTGDELRYALGLPSSCFVLEPWEGGIRAVSRGVGHGYGMSQFTANEKAKEGWSAEDILGYFYKNIAVISE